MADSELRRTHPLTVAVRTASTVGQAVVAFVALSFIGSAGGRDTLATIGLAAMVVLGALITSAFAWLNWAFFRYGVQGTDLVITEGWLIKKHRAIPLARVQGIDIRAGLVARVLGLADVIVQTAGGGEGEPEARIGSIPLSDAERLRANLLLERDEVADSRTGETIVGPDPVGRMSDLRGVLGGVEVVDSAPVFEYRLPLSRLVIAGVTSNAVLATTFAGIAFTAQIGEVFGSAFDRTAGLLASLAVPVLVAVSLLAVAVVVTVSIAVVVARDFGFVARRVRDRLETEAGLTERRMTSLPVRRIQAVRIEQPPLRRLIGFTSVYADTAGFGRGEQQKSTTAAAILPLARAKEVRPLMHELLPEAEQFPTTRPVPRRALRFYVTWPTILSAGITLLVVGVGLQLVAPLADDDALTAAVPGIVAIACLAVATVTAVFRAAAWRGAAFGADESALCIERGMLGRYTVRLSRSRIQSLTWRQTPFQARAGLATLSVASVSGSSGANHVVRNIELEDARRLAEWYSPS
ncbi:MAG: PH domain-containing protein [Coriobacteriia bacterium]|nr:PH domain-containing protein [Coriobacteriia bacterium]